MKHGAVQDLKAHATITFKVLPLAELPAAAGLGITTEGRVEAVSEISKTQKGYDRRVIMSAPHMKHKHLQTLRADQTSLFTTSPEIRNIKHHDAHTHLTSQLRTPTP